MPDQAVLLKVLLGGLVLALVVAIVASIRELVLDLNRPAPDDDPGNVQAAPRRVSTATIVCNWKLTPECQGVLHAGAPGGVTYESSCLPCERTLQARSALMNETLRRMAS